MLRPRLAGGRDRPLEDVAGFRAFQHTASRHDERRARFYLQCGLRLRRSWAHPPVPGEGWDVDVRWGPDFSTTRRPPTRRESGCGRVRRRVVLGDGHGIRLPIHFQGCGEFTISTDLSEVWSAGTAPVVPCCRSSSRERRCVPARTAREDRGPRQCGGADGTALAFVGQSGRGKSTLAALICLEAVALVTDDVLTVDPGPPGDLSRRCFRAPPASGRG